MVAKSHDPTEAKKEITELAKAINKMQKRLDKGEFLSKREVSELTERLRSASIHVPNMPASW